MFKFLIQHRLETYVKRYFKTHPEVKLVVVAGSVGKTSTKMAIATVLAEKFRVRLHEGNHNSDISAPLAMLGIEYPTFLRDPRQWSHIFKAAKARIMDPTEVDVIVQEIGTEHSGEIPHFGTYLKPDIAVISAISPEHMEFFKTMDAVAIEELSAANFSKAALINRDDIDDEYAKYITNANLNTYGTSPQSEYHFTDQSFNLKDGHTGDFTAPEWPQPLAVTVKVVGEHNLRPAVAAGAVGVKLGMNAQEIKRGLEKVRAVAGRMNLLEGQNGTAILDDTYNSSPLAVSSALQTLYSIDAPSKIAVLGSMNELGESSQLEHQTLGMLCDPTQLEWVITVGDEAEKYVAPAAKSRGCQVRSFKTPLEAGTFVHQNMKPGAVILFKGSQGGIFLEEAIKIILHDTADEEKLVRQSEDWLEKKNRFFAQFQKAGFTIVELLIVIVVIGILAAITIVAYNGIQTQAVTATVKSDLESSAKLLGDDNAVNSAYPATAALANGGQGLKPSPGTVFTYTYTAATNTYCLTATNGSIVYYIAPGLGPQSGACPPNTNPTWTQLTTSGSATWYGLASSSDGTKIAAIISFGYIYTSANSGATWTQQTAVGSRGWTSITSSADGTKLAAVASTGVVYTSADSGSTWTAHTVSGASYLSSIASSSDGTKLVAVDVAPGYIYTSTDSGSTWTQQTSAGSHYWNAVASSTSGATILAANGGSSSGLLYLSTSSGSSWASQSVGSYLWASVGVSGDGNTLVGIVTGNGVYTSTNGGSSWSARPGAGSLNFHRIAISNDGTHIIVTSNTYVVTSLDSGATWTQQTNLGSANWWGVAMSSDGSKAYAAVAGGYIYSTSY